MASPAIQAQTNHNFHTWFSLVNTLRFSDKWGMLADFHVRRAEGIAEPGFNFIRLGGYHWINNQWAASAGVGKIWVYPARDDYHTVVKDRRLYEQVTYRHSAGKTSLSHRLRVEHVWRNQVVDDVFTGRRIYYNRFRYQVNWLIPVFKNPKWKLQFSNETILQNGEVLSHNTFDQNRIFGGLQYTFNPRWKFDFGYMNFYQLKASGFNDMNHTYRMWFYFTPDFRK